MSDPFQSTLVLLLHGEGANNATVFPDTSQYAHTISGGSANAKISTTQFKFGASSMFTDGNGILTCPAAAEFQIVPGQDFTFEEFVFLAAASGFTASLFALDLSNVGPFAIGLNGGRAVTAQCRDAGGSAFVSILGSTLLPLNTWHHIAFVRQFNTYTLYVNGVSEGSPVTSATAVKATSTTVWVLGDSNFGPYPQSYIDELRYSNGVARYTGNFTPPAVPFDDYQPGVFGGTVYGKLAPGLVYHPVVSANLGNARPRVWQPAENMTVKVAK